MTFNWQRIFYLSSGIDSSVSVFDWNIYWIAEGITDLSLTFPSLQFVQLIYLCGEELRATLGTVCCLICLGVHFPPSFLLTLLSISCHQHLISSGVVHKWCHTFREWGGVILVFIFVEERVSVKKRGKGSFKFHVTSFMEDVYLLLFTHKLCHVY